MLIELPFPAAELFPNRKNGRHWTATSDAKTRARNDAHTLTLVALAKSGRPAAWAETMPVGIVFVMPDKRVRDLDNCLAAAKAALDGVALALKVDDSRFRPITIDWRSGGKPGAMLVTIGCGA